MLDQFLVGRVSRISPEAPVPIVEFEHEENRIGGAANVAHNIARSAGGSSSSGSSGHDAAGDRLASALRGARSDRRPRDSSTIRRVPPR